MMKSANVVEASSDLFQVVVGLIHDVSAKSRSAQITPQSLLLEELTLDSLDLVRVIMLVEDRYHIAIDLDEIPKLKQVSDLTELLGARSRRPPDAVPPRMVAVGLPHLRCRPDYQE